MLILFFSLKVLKSCLENVQCYVLYREQCKIQVYKHFQCSILYLSCFKMWPNTYILIILNVFQTFFIFHSLGFLSCGVFYLSAGTFWRNNHCTLVDNEIFTSAKANLNFPHCLKLWENWFQIFKSNWIIKSLKPNVPCYIYF